MGVEDNLLHANPNAILISEPPHGRDKLTVDPHAIAGSQFLNEGVVTFDNNTGMLP